MSGGGNNSWLRIYENDPATMAIYDDDDDVVGEREGNDSYGVEEKEGQRRRAGCFISESGSDRIWESGSLQDQAH